MKTTTLLMLFIVTSCGKPGGFQDKELVIGHVTALEKAWYVEGYAPRATSITIAPGVMTIIGLIKKDVGTSDCTYNTTHEIYTPNPTYGTFDNVLVAGDADICEQMEGKHTYSGTSYEGKDHLMFAGLSLRPL